MDVPSGLGLLAVILLVLANGFFVATEFAIVAVRRSRLEELIAKGNARAKLALEVTKNLDTYIAACQLGITISSLALGWIGEPALAHLIEPPLERIAGSFAPALAHTIAIAVAFTVITTLHIVVGELAPKGLALQKTEGTVLWVAAPIRVFYLIFRLPTQLLNAVGNGLLRLFGMQPASEREMAHSVSELQVLMKGMERTGVVDSSEAKMASRAIEFGDLTAGSLMTPRTRVEAIPVSTPLDELVKSVASGSHTRLPVYEGTLDDVIGILHTRDIFRIAYLQPSQFDLRTIVRPVVHVPDSKPAVHLLEQMRADRQQIAVVIDEFGGTAGIVTIEDLAAALIGRIEAEAAHGSALPQRMHVRREMPDGSLLLDGLTRLGEFEEITGIDLNEAEFDSDTVGGLVMELMGRIPSVGDMVVLGGRTLRVEQLSGMRVSSVRVIPDATPLPQTRHRSQT